VPRHIVIVQARGLPLPGRRRRQLEILERLCRGYRTSPEEGLARMVKPLDEVDPKWRRSVRAGAAAEACYLIESYTLNIGRYMAMTMKPTIEPTITIITGSRIDVSAFTAASTCSS
jgi:hypothetical protein